MSDDLTQAMASLLEQELLAAMAPAKAEPSPAAIASGDRRLEDDVRRIAAEALRMSESALDPRENLANFGVDSIAITEIMAKISRHYGIAVAPTTFFEAKHLDDLAAILRQRHATTIAAHYAPPTPMAPPPRPVERAAPPSDWLARHRKARSKMAPAQPLADAPIAIIAMEGVFPQSPDLDALATHLRAGDDCVTEVPPERWDWRAVYGDPRQGPFTKVNSGGFAPAIDTFDAAFFRIAPREAELIDPQHRLFMQCVVSLIERAGHAPSSLAGRKVALFVGLNLLDYTNMANRAGLMDAQQMTGLGHAFCPNRLSFWLDIHGPSEVVDTACSSSLVALNRAVMAIRHEGCEMAIAGGANLMLNADQHVVFSQVGMLAEDGRCKTFAAEADGYGRADGVAAVLLKRLDQAEADGDPILGVIRGIAEHHGGTTTSLTAPKAQAQARLIVEAHRRAGVDPRSVTLIECHGTGTKLGDPVETDGLKQAFAQLYADRGLPPPATPQCGLGSIKSNIGHTETTAGIAGLIKVLLAMADGVRYQSLHCARPNPLIDLAGSPFFLLQQAQPWPRPLIDGIEQPRRAGLSSFGAGGTNVHVVLEEYRPRPAALPVGPRPLVVPVSAHGVDSLKRMVTALRPLVGDSDLDALAFTLQRGRDPRRHRVAFVVSDTTDLARQMDAFLAGQHLSAATGPAAELAQAWQAGGEVDWDRLDPTPRRRLSLPGTRFVGKRYWLPLTETAPAAPAGGFELVAHGADCWRLRLDESAFYLADHRLGDQAVLPGVATLELARAICAAAGLPARSWRNVVWVKPLAVSGHLNVEITLQRGQGLLELAALTDDGGRQVHAQIHLDDDVVAPRRADLAALAAAHPRAFTAAQIYAAFATLGLNYGPGHRTISHLSTNLDGGSVLARLELPSCVAATLAAYPLHPSLLDGAFQAAIGVALDNAGQPSESGAALPFAVGRIAMLAPCPARIWVHIRPAATAEAAQRVRSLDLDLYDDDGALVVSIAGFATRVAVTERPAPDLSTFVPAWKPVALATAPSHDNRLALLAGDFPLPAGWTTQFLGGDFTAQAQRLLAILQAQTGPVRLTLVCPEERPELAGLAGMLRSAALERPGLTVQTLMAPTGSAIAAALDNTAPSGTSLRLATGQLQQEVWQETRLPAVPLPWRDGKTYLITGGGGGLGLVLATSIRAQAPQAAIVLTGRNDNAPAWAAELSADYLRCDLADPAQTQALVDAIRDRHGRVDGVLHAAGCIKDQSLSRKTSDEVAAVLAAKVSGTVNLEQALAASEPDFFVLFSSLSAQWGNPGQADYAAANGFLDHFAASRPDRVVSIAWPLWEEGGMTLDAQARTLMTRTTGLVPLPTATGLAVLAAAIAARTPRLAVLIGDGARLRRRMGGQAMPAAAATAPTATSTPHLQAALLGALTQAAAKQLKVEPDDLEPDQELTEYGFDSIGFTQFANGLNTLLDLELTPPVFFEHPTLGGLAGYLARTHGPHLADKLGIAVPQAVAVPTLAPIPASPPPGPQPHPSTQADGVAIIAMSGVFPQSPDLDTFWRNLEQGRDCITEIPPERWDWHAYWGDPLKQPGRCNVRWGGFIAEMAEFDAAFFGLSAPEARMMDPQQRLLLTQSWRLFEAAGIAPQALSGSDTGVFIGTADTGYGRLLAQAGGAVEGYTMTGLAPSLGPNRISYHFNFHGPSVAVETACSSALVAVHRAVEAIAAGHCRLAIAGGVNALLLPDAYVGFAKAGMLSPEGRCKTFAADADGYARGEGIGLVLLKNLAAARADGDPILAVIRASGENHGGRAGSLTAPNPKAQAELLRAVHARAGTDPRSIGYIEAHGTGTPLGDPIEVEALKTAFAALDAAAEAQFGPAPAPHRLIGSVKSNIGHLELAAGIAGLIKVVLQLRHRRIVASLHCTSLNPYLKLDGTSFAVAQTARDWPAPAGGQPRRAGVSSFGFGGANAHVVVEEYTAPSPIGTPSTTGPVLLALSAHTPDALRHWAQALRDHLRTDTAALADIAHSLARREAMEHRLAFVVSGPAEAAARLDAFLSEQPSPGLFQGRVKDGRAIVSVLESDDALRHAIAGLAARGRLDGVAELWVRGLAVNWTDIAPGKAVALPPYPLARTRYWPQQTPATATVASVPQPMPAPEPQAPPEPDFDALATLTALAAAVLEVDGNVLDPDSELGEFGFDSITMTGFAAKVNAALDLSLTPADFFEFATLRRLAAHVAGLAKPVMVPAIPATPTASTASTPADADAIVITGFSCHFPDARDAETFWDNLISGHDSISLIPAERWDWRALDGDPKQEPDKTNIHWGGFIDGVFEFDPLFFGISPREAKLMDPQQRLMMMQVWKAIEDAGHDPHTLAGRKVGLFVATSSSGYRDVIGADSGAEGYVATGAVPSVGPNRISYFLDWHGPSEPVETACSSSLVALHRAVQAIRAGDCDMAVVGGVNTIVTPEAHINFAKAGMLSPDGRCKTFSAQANGYGRGEGVGMVVLRRLTEAEADGDPILAVVRATAVNHGGRANSLTAPNTAAQAALLRTAQTQAGCAPATIGYVETHGTGTALGDPVEINALKAAFGDCGGDCALGSVKTNIGHLELAAGIAGLIKVLLQMTHGQLAPSLHSEPPNPYIDLSGSPLRIVRAAEPWRPARDEHGQALPRRAGISSFGFGGVNAHVIVEQYGEAPTPAAVHDGPLVLVLSARDGERLREQAANLLAFLTRHPDTDLADLAFTLQVGRAAMRQRLAAVVASLENVIAVLRRFLAGDDSTLYVGKRDAGPRSGPTVALDQDPDAIAQAWAAGGEVAWTRLYPEQRRRLRLPGYPFARAVYRIVHPETQAAVSAPTVFTRRLDADDFVLRDHRVMGARVLPGAMGLELARAAWSGDRPFTPLVLSRVVWQHPVRLDSGAVTLSVPLTLLPNGAHSFRLLSEQTEAVAHMQGEVAVLTGDGGTLEIAVIQDRCHTPLDAEALYRAYAALGLDYGPAFRSVEQVWCGPDEVLARLRRPAAANGDFILHPSLLDGAFQAALGLFRDQGDPVTALPFGLDRLELFAPTTERMWAQVRRGTSGNGIHRLELTVSDDDGRVALRLSGFSLRELKRSAPPVTDLESVAVRDLAALVAQEAGLPQDAIEAEAELEVYGIDSMMIVHLTERLEARFGPLPKTLFFEYRTIKALAGYFAAHHGAALTALVGTATAADTKAPPPTPLRQSGPAPRLQPADSPIAIIGMAGRFPGARDLNEFWPVLRDGRDCISEIPPERWNAAARYDPHPGTPGKSYGKWGGFIDDFDRFDPMFFNIAPREAGFMDPQERLFLQCAWETLENAGHTRASLAGAEVGVFVGVMYQEYQLHGDETLALNGSAATIANRVSYFCGFSGPSLAVDTMCSSSLTAIHLACEAIRAGDCRAALAGGVNLSLHPHKYLGLAQGRFLSSTGRCESFGQGGDGYVPGEGVGAVLLKPLDQALADGDRVLAVIRGSALNHGGKTNGYTVPNPDAQAAVIGKALTRAGVSATDIGYVEAHGTGTKLGDPIEIAALARAFARHTDRTGFCPIGSVKSNVGHCESAAGMAGLAKVLLQLRHRQLVPSLHADTLNPGIDFTATPFVVQRTLAPWPDPGRPRLAGLSSFGAGGANAHLIIEDAAPPAPTPRRQNRLAVFPLSARDPERLREMTQRLRAALTPLSDDDLDAVAFTLQQGREAFEERVAIVATTMAELRAELDGVLTGHGHYHRGHAERGVVAGGNDPDSLAAAWVKGAKVSWPPLAPARIALPSYPFARERYWLPDALSATTTTVVPAAPALPLLFTPRWQPQPVTAAPAAARCLVVLCQPAANRVNALRAELAPAEVVVQPGDDYGDHARRLLALLQTLFKQRPDSAQVVVVVPLASALEGLSGLLLSAAQERPQLRGQLVALDYAAADAASRLRAELESADSVVRHQDGQRLVRQWRELTLPAATGPWRDDGIYLISGGAGGVGLLVAEAIAARCRRPRLWLSGRSPLSATTRARLDQLDAQVHYRQADVADPTAMAALIDDITYAHGALNGIIHAAGLTRDSLLVRKSADDLDAVLRPKVDGVLALDAASRALRLDFFALFASVSGALGNAGQSDYAAANAFLDGFAERRNAQVASGQRHGHTVALDWPYWQDGGMRLEAGVIATMERGVGARPLTTPAALATLDAVLAQSIEAQVLILDGDHDRLRRLLAPVMTTPPAPIDAAPAAAPQAIRDRVAACFAEVLGIPADKLTDDSPLDRFGVDSVSALSILAALEGHFGPLPPTLLFEQPSIARLSAELARQQSAVPSVPPPQPTARTGDIAILAVAGRYPGADTPEALWTLLESGADAIGEFPAERGALTYSPRQGQPGASHCRWGGFLDGIELFDAPFFGYSPRAAALADPQERLFLQTAWHLLERAGLTRQALRQRYDARVGVFVGAMFQHYREVATDDDSRALLALGSYGIIANKLSYFLDLEGPSVAVDSMCSSGLQAVHQACQSLRAGECRLAIAGGVSLSPRALKFLGLSRAGLAASSPDSRAFADGDGYLPAEGVGAVLLKPLEHAQADGDAILAVIKASAANHGGHSAGFGVPNAEAQARLIEDVIRQSGIPVETIGTVETAASGAALGDAIEIRALSRAFARFTAKTGFCALGSVKASIGHAEAASGLAQLTKIVLQLQHRRLLPPRAPARPNPALALDATPFVLPAQAADWPAPLVDGVAQPRRAALSSFGAGGSNLHMIIEEGPAIASAASARRPYRFPLSARTPQQLADMAAALAAFVRANPGLPLARLSATLRLGRETMASRLQVVAADAAELAAKLDAARPGETFEDMPEQEDDTAGPPLVLPGYPFARERHWIDDEAPPTAAAAAAATTAGEDVVLATLAAELGVGAATIDCERDFAALGVDSMIALRLAYAVEEATGLRLDRRLLTRYPTPAALAAFLATRPAAQPKTAAEPRPAGPWSMAMTEGQKGLWVVQSLYPDNAGYNVPLAFRLDHIDTDLLARAWRHVLASHPILTARLDPEALVLTAGTAAVLERIALPKGMEPLDFARRLAARPFDLVGDGPSRAQLLHGGALAEGQAILLLTFHHLVFDGATAAIVARDLWRAHAALAAGHHPDDAEGADFAAFGSWEQTLMQSAAGQAQRDYWLGVLADPPPVLELPADRPPAAGGAIDGQSLERRLPVAAARAARQLAATLDITPASFYLGVLALLLQRLSGQRDLVIGVPTLRRPSRAFATTVGYFVNMLAPRLEVSDGASAAQVLRDVHQRLTAGLDHGDYPFAAIARAVGGGLDGQPPYQVSYTYQNFPLGTPVELPPQAGQVSFIAELRQPGDGPFGLEIHRDGDSLRLVAGYDGARFDAATIERLLDHFVRLVKAVCAAPDSPAASLPLLSATERRRLAGWGRPAALPAATGLVPHWIAATAKRHPDRVAVSVGERTLGYRKLIRRANRLARLLGKRGVGRGDTAAVLLGRDVDSIVALLACLFAGVTWVPLDAEAPAARLADMVADSGARIVLTKGSLADRVGPSVAVLDLEREAKTIAKQRAGRLDIPVTAADAAYMIYTSGSTGRPKGVVVSHGALAEHCRAVAALFAVDETDVVLQFAPHVVDTALEQILPTLMAGARLVLRDGPVWTADSFRRFLAEQRISVADLPPAYLREVLLAWRQDTAAPPQLRLVVVGGEALSPDTVRLWQASPLAGLRLLNAYGPTEATITALAHEVGGAPTTAIPIGRPLPGTEIRIVDTNGNSVPEGVVGELWIGGNRLAQGYHRRPELTAEKFVTATDGTRLYRTGDLARFVPGGNGVVAFHGRLDHQVKIRGFRVELGEIETALAGLGLREAAVVPRSDATGGQILVAYVVPDGAWNEAALRTHLARRLPAHMLPAAYVPLPALPITTSGKLDRAALPAPHHDHPASAHAHARDGIEGRLTQLWAKVLERPPASIGIHDDFVICGGHSLAWVRLLHDIATAFTQPVTATDFAAAHTIATQAAILRSLRHDTRPHADLDEAVPLRPVPGAAVTLFLVHTVTGDVDGYGALARRLAPTVAVYGLGDPGLKDADVTRLAAHHVATLRRIQPIGPYHLGGWSMGGVLAYEMARQLRQTGETVALLCLIDSYTPERIQQWDHASAARTPLAQFGRDVLGVDGDDGVVTTRLADDDSGLLRRMFDRFQDNNRALMAYRPQPCDLFVLLLACGDADHGWTALAGGGIDTRLVPGDHLTVLASPAVDSCAHFLDEALTCPRKPR